MKVITNNFQILEGRNEFEFKPGINLIVGPNASGKSSLFYAIENALTNPNGVDECIHFDHKSTDVTIENNGNSLTWIRTNSSSTYVNNNTQKEYVKASKLDSRDIMNLGFYFDNKNKVLNIHNEWSVLFPFGESDTEMFRLFEDIFNISCSFQIIDEMKKDEQTFKNCITTNQNEKINLFKNLDILKEIDSKVNKSDIEKHITNIEKTLEETSTLREDLTTYASSLPLTRAFFPKLFDVTDSYNLSHNYEELQKVYERYVQEERKKFIEVPKISLSLDFESADTIRNDYEQYCVTKSNITEYNDELSTLKMQVIEINKKIDAIKVCPTCGRPL